MPAERLQSFAAAGLHGANSARSIALAVVVQTPASTHAAIIIFMLKQVPSFDGRRLRNPNLKQKLHILCAAQMPQLE
jgi:hypothetical protein